PKSVSTRPPAIGAAGPGSSCVTPRAVCSTASAGPPAGGGGAGSTPCEGAAEGAGPPVWGWLGGGVDVGGAGEVTFGPDTPPPPAGAPPPATAPLPAAAPGTPPPAETRVSASCAAEPEL